MLKAFAQDIWLIDGSTVDVAGFSYPTRAAVIRLTSGDLLVWSPVRLDDTWRDVLAQLGTIKFLVAPNMFHHLFLDEWQSAYPTAQLFGLQALHRKRADLHFSGALDGAEPLPWQTELSHVVVPNKLTSEAVFFHRASGTVLFTDLIQQFPKGFHSGWRRTIAKLDLMIGETPNVPRKFRLGFGAKAKARRLMKPILDWPCERIVMAHGTPVETHGAKVLRQSFDWLF